MRFSIITINRNNAAGLESTIRSVMGQTYSDFEYIIVDGASTDNSVEVIRDLISPTPDPSPEGEGGGDSEENGWRYCALSQSALPLLSGEGQGVRLHWISEPDKGIYNAMNKGVRMAHGDYLLFLNSGDTFASPDVLSNVAQQVLPFGVALPRQTGEPEGGIKTIEDLGGASDLGGALASILIGRVNVVKNGVITGQSEELSEENLTLFNLYLWGVPHQAAFIRRELLLTHPYDEDLKINSDWKFFIQTIVLNNVSVKTVPLLIADYDGEGISTVHMDWLLEEREKVFKELIPERIASNYLHVFPHYYEVKRVKWLLKHKLFYRLYRMIASLGMKICKK